jgi:hypothetical protein
MSQNDDDDDDVGRTNFCFLMQILSTSDTFVEYNLSFFCCNRVCKCLLTNSFPYRICWYVYVCHHTYFQDPLLSGHNVVPPYKTVRLPSCYHLTVETRGLGPPVAFTNRQHFGLTRKLYSLKDGKWAEN